MEPQLGSRRICVDWFSFEFCQQELDLGLPSAEAVTAVEFSEGLRVGFQLFHSCGLERIETFHSLLRGQRVRATQSFLLVCMILLQQ